MIFKAPEKRIILSAAIGISLSFSIMLATSLDINMDRPGSDYRNFDLASADPNMCAAACQDDPGCQAFSYNPPGMSGPNAKCWLKNGVPAKVAADGVVSGVKGGSAVSTTSQIPIDLIAPSISININAIEGKASSGNGEPIKLIVNVTKIVKNSQPVEDICGLDASNFKIETLTVPPYGATVGIKSVAPAPHPNFMYGQSPCNHEISIIPTSYQGKQSTWLNGKYVLKLDYIKGGHQLASREFKFYLNEQMIESFQSFQQKMQKDNMQFNLISNVNKAEHDTAKNVINNIR